MPNKKHKKLSLSYENDDMDLTPLIDVLFVLILFFMLIIGTNVQNINVALPSAKTASSSEVMKTTTIEITANNNYLISKTKLTFKNINVLEKYLLKNNTSKDSIVIAADKNSKSEKLIQLMTLLEKQGYKTAQIAILSK